MKWKLRLTTIMEGKTNTITVEADTREDARAIYEADWSRFNHLDSIEIAATKKEIINMILMDMSGYERTSLGEKARTDGTIAKLAEAEWGGYLRRQSKAELENILEARLGHK